LTDKVRAEITKIPEVVGIESAGSSTVVTADDNISKQLEDVVLRVTGLKLEMKVEEFELEEIYMKYFKES